MLLVLSTVLLFLSHSSGEDCFATDADCANPHIPDPLPEYKCSVTGTGSCWCSNARVCEATVENGAVYCGTSQSCTAHVKNGAIFSQLTGDPDFTATPDDDGHVSVFLQKAGNSSVDLLSGTVYCEESLQCDPVLNDLGSVYCQNTIHCTPTIAEGNFVCTTTNSPTEECEVQGDDKNVGEKVCPDFSTVGQDEACENPGDPVPPRADGYDPSLDFVCTDRDLCINEIPGRETYTCIQHAAGTATTGTGVCFCGDAKTCIIDKDDGTSSCERAQNCLVRQKTGAVHCQQSANCEVEMTNGDVLCEDAQVCNVRTSDGGNLFCEQSPYCKGNFLQTGDVRCESSVACDATFGEVSGTQTCSDGTTVKGNNFCFGVDSTIPPDLLPPPTMVPTPLPTAQLAPTPLPTVDPAATVQEDAGPCHIGTGACVSTTKLNYDCNIEETGICFCKDSAVCTANVTIGAVYCGKAQKCLATVTDGVIFAEQAGPNSNFAVEKGSVYLQRANSPFDVSVHEGKVFCEDRDTCSPRVDSGAIFCQQAHSCLGSVGDGAAICDHADDAQITCDTDIDGKKQKVCPDGTLLEIDIPCKDEHSRTYYQGIDRSFEQGDEESCSAENCFNTKVRLAKYTCNQAKNPAGNCYCGDADVCVVHKQAGTTECEKSSTCIVEHTNGGVVHCQQANNCTVSMDEGEIMCEESVICEGKVAPDSGFLHCENSNYCRGTLDAGNVYCDSAIACEAAITASGGKKICADGHQTRVIGDACFQNFVGTFPPQPTPTLPGDVANENGGNNGGGGGGGGSSKGVIIAVVIVLVILVLVVAGYCFYKKRKDNSDQVDYHHQLLDDGTGRESIHLPQVCPKCQTPTKARDRNCGNCSYKFTVN